MNTFDLHVKSRPWTTTVIATDNSVQLLGSLPRHSISVPCDANNNNQQQHCVINIKENPDENETKFTHFDADQTKVHKQKWTLKNLFACCAKSTTKSANKHNELDIAKEITIKEHLFTFAELEKKLATNIEKGLSQADAEMRLKKDGPNAFSQLKSTSWWVILFNELTSGFALIMWAAVIASLVVYGFDLLPQDYYLAIVLAAVVIITGIYSFSQQHSSSKIFESFKNMIPQETTVIRDGKQCTTSVDKLVVGDIVLCNAGQQIPADVRIISCEGMKVDNSSITGESEALTRSPEAKHESPLEAKNIAFFSTSCVSGSGVCMVIATGDNTVMGKIAKLVTSIEQRKSPINVEIHRFVVLIAILAIAEGVIFFIVCLVLGISVFQAIIFMIGIVVGNIPEGLLPALTLALTLTAKRMAKKNCMIKYLEAVETLGSTSTICSDKTGTLTTNRMTVKHCYLGGRIVSVSHNASEVDSEMQNLVSCWNSFKRCAKLCSCASFIDDNVDIDKRECRGDASESAILRFMESVSPSVEQYRQRYPKVAERPFSSVYKYQFSVHANTDQVKQENANFFLVMKGAPERIIKLCTTIINSAGDTIQLTEQDIEYFEEAYRELGSMGERVLALCDMELPQFAPDHKFNLDEHEEFVLEHLRFIGLIAMIDPPKDSVPSSIAKCKLAGITVVMVTGDHPITAQSIAKSIGLITESHRRSTQISLPKIDRKYSKTRNTASIVVPGDELDILTDEQLREILCDFKQIVFARTSPQQKLRLVENFQALGQIVAVTGDGVNDSPALKKADIGVAMGITGSDVSKQAADMVLLDDDFASIVVGVEEGRKIFDNLKKTIAYIMAGNFSTIFPFIVYIIFGIPVSISPIMILCIALGTDMVPAISLAYEKAESDIMHLAPRNPKQDFLVTRSLLLWCFFQGGFIISFSGYMGYFVTLMQYGFMPWQFWQMRNRWDADIDITDWYGQELTLFQRKVIMTQGQTSYFVAVVVVQWMDVIVNKTRRVSIFTHGIDNWFLNVSILFETAIACLVVYTPYLNEMLTFAPVSFWAWCSGVPFFFYLLVYEELRKWIVRQWPDSFFGQELKR